MEFILFILIIIAIFLIIDHIINLIVNILLSTSRFLRVVMVVGITGFLICVYIDPEWTANLLRWFWDLLGILIGWGVSFLRFLLESIK